MRRSLLMQFTRFVVRVCCLTCLAACGSVLGLDEFSVVQQTDDDQVSGRSCSLHRDCGESVAQYRCAPSLKRCAALRTDDCSVIAGPDRDDRAVWIGMLASISGVQTRANAARQISAVLAVDSINASGGVPLDAAATDVHPLVLIACDSRDMSRAASYLVSALGVRAIIGPDESQDAVALATKLAIPNDVLVLGPTATDTRLGDLLDDGLEWSMAPNDALRAPWLHAQLNALESALHASRGRSELKLAIVVRDDAQGQSARASLAALTFGGKPLTDPANLADRVRIDGYSPNATDYAALVDADLQFGPDIVMVFGLAEAVTQIMTPLEEGWAAKRAAEPAPEYVLTDAAKVPELLELVARSAELRERVRGIGVTYTADAREVNSDFRETYRQRYDRQLAGVSGLDATFDAVHAIAFALASTRKLPTSGRELAAGLRALSNGQMPVDVRADQLGSSLRRMAAGTSLRVMGALAPLVWDERGVPAASALEVWCVGTRDGRVEFASSGLRAELPNAPPALGAHGCSGPARANDAPTATGVGTSTANAPAGPDSSAPAGSAPSQPPAAMPDGQPGAPVVSGDAGVPMRPPATASASIPCGATACDPSAGEYCCVSTLRGLTEDPQPQDFSCNREAGTCGIALHCSSDSDCEGGNVCCGITNTTQCMPEAMCSSRAGTRLECESSSGCGVGQLCCAHLAPNSASYAAIACAPECDTLDQAILLCRSDADCAGTPLTPNCVPSRVIPNLELCGL